MYICGLFVVLRGVLTAICCKISDQNYLEIIISINI